MDRTAAATTEPDQPSPQEELKGRQHEEGDTRSDRRLLRALAGAGSLRDEELRKAIDFEGDRAEWKRRLWRLHNEGYVKVRWVGLADPDPVEARITGRGLAAAAGPGDRSSA
jgi:hypothetical protein